MLLLLLIYVHVVVDVVVVDVVVADVVVVDVVVVDDANANRSKFIFHFDNSRIINCSHLSDVLPDQCRYH